MHTAGAFGRGVRRETDRSIARLAVPALGALIAEPLFLLTDSALVGHLGADPLAGLGVASAILTTVVGLMVFLAYATTPRVARLRGAGDLPAALRAGVDGLWLAFGLGIPIAGVMAALCPWLVSLFGVASAPAEQATLYLLVSCAGLPAMLLVFAAAGLLRGLQDTMTPLRVAGTGFAVNAALNALFIYGFGWGIAGSAWGTVLAQWGMVLAYVWVIARHGRAAGVGPWPRRAGVRHVGGAGGWLFVRTVGLRAAMLVTVFAATSQGTAATAGYQVVFTVFSTAAFALDALAIAAQTLIAQALGAGDRGRVRFILRRTLWWGVVCGGLVGVALIGLSAVAGQAFTSDPSVLAVLPPAFVVLGLSLPLCGVVFVLDGVLMGAGDGRYLAWTSMVNLLCYLPVLWAVAHWAPSGVAGLTALTAALVFGFMSARLVTLSVRARSERWLVLGPSSSGRF